LAVDPAGEPDELLTAGSIERRSPPGQGVRAAVGRPKARRRDLSAAETRDRRQKLVDGRQNLGIELSEIVVASRRLASQAGENGGEAERNERAPAQVAGRQLQGFE